MVIVILYSAHCYCILHGDSKIHRCATLCTG